jgi:Putative transposase
MGPPWAWLQVERWLAKQTARLLAGDHDQVIFPGPHELNALWLANVEAMTQRLCASGPDTWRARLGDGTYLGATPGLMATRHPWTPTLVLHPHVPCLVTGGGLTDTGRWVAVRHGCLLPMRVVMAVFRGKLRAAIRHGCAPGTRTLPVGQRPPQLDKLLNTLGRQQWHVHSRER